MVKIALCDDNEIERDILKNIIQVIFDEMGRNCSIIEFSSGEKLQRNFSKGDYDIIFLDIHMKLVNGIDTGKSIREKDAKVEIVFATVSDDYLREGYDVHALAYLLKPYEVQRVRETIQYYLSKNEKSNETDEEILEIAIQQKKIFIRQKDINWLESEGRIVWIYCKNNVYKVYARLNDIEKKLNASRFLRCNQSYIVNIFSVEGVKGYDFRLSDDKLIPIRKRDRKEIVQKYYNKRNQFEESGSGG